MVRKYVCGHVNAMFHEKPLSILLAKLDLSRNFASWPPRSRMRPYEYSTYIQLQRSFRSSLAALTFMGYEMQGRDLLRPHYFQSAHDWKFDLHSLEFLSSMVKKTAFRTYHRRISQFVILRYKRSDYISERMNIFTYLGANACVGCRTTK